MGIKARLAHRRGLGVVALGMMLAACGGDGSSSGGSESSPRPSASTQQMQGTAAVGQAIQNATVTAICQDGSGFTVSPVTTDAQGKWSGKVASGQWPCLLRLQGGSPAVQLSSMAFTAGTANITPLTDLALVMAGADADMSWAGDSSGWPDKASIQASATSLMAALKDKGYAGPTLSGSPFTSAFDANGTGWDAVLDNLRALVEDPSGAIDGYQALARMLAEGNLNSLPDHEGGSGTTDPAAQAPVGSADLGSDPSPEKAAFFEIVSKSWPVAIYQVPATNPEWYGLGSLNIGGTTSNWTMELKGADGSTISSLSASGSISSALSPFYATDFGPLVVYQPGQVFINKGTDVSEFLNSFEYWDSGLIKGSAGGFGQVYFRNSVEAYGAVPPDVFEDLAGTWSGTAQVLCDGPYGPANTVTNTMTITRDGHFTLQGQTQLCGGELPQEMEWGGNDDFLIPGPEPSDGAYLMHIDIENFPNVSEGKVQIRFNEDMTVQGLSGWVGGELFEMRNARKQ